MHSNLFTTISVIDTTAKLLGGPIMASAFALRNQSGQTYGLCFLLSAVSNQKFSYIIQSR
jgi:hypothetical protein